MLCQAALEGKQVGTEMGKTTQEGGKVQMEVGHFLPSDPEKKAEH